MQYCACDDVEQISFEEFIPYIAVNVDGVPSNVMGHMARLSTIEFAKQTKMLKRTLWLDVQECVRVYNIALEDCYTLMMFDQVCYGDTPLRVDRQLACCPTETCTYAFEPPGCFYLGISPSHDERRCVEMRATVAPGQDSCSVDKWLYDRHAEAIAEGALYRILTMQGEDWYNPQVGMMHGRNFNHAVAEATADRLSGYSCEPTKMRMPAGMCF